MLINIFTDKKWISAITAILFAVLPFYAVYGLSVAGQPLLIYAFYHLYKKKRVWLNLLIIAFVTLSSSFVLIGWAFCLVGLIFFIYLLCKKKLTISILIGLGEMYFIYFLTNITLFLQVFTKAKFVSHKEELVLTTTEFGKTFLSILIDGYYHVPTLHLTVGIVCLVTLLVCGICYRRLEKGMKKIYKILAVIVILNILIALFYSVIRLPFFVDLRNTLGGAFKYFQFDRIYWFYPLFWYCGLGFSLILISRLFPYKKLNLILAIVVILVVSIIRFYSQIDYNYQNKTISYRNFYSEELFSQVKQFIDLPKNKYRVGCLGIHPSILLHNGFYTIDGYSNNYDIEYKHKFRQVIEGELSKNQIISDYFDNWGNRCYLFSSELGLNYMWNRKDNKKVKNLSFNVQALKQLNTKYIISTVRIRNARLKGLKLKKVFDDQKYMRIYLYRLS